MLITPFCIFSTVKEQFRVSKGFLCAFKVFLDWRKKLSSNSELVISGGVDDTCLASLSECKLSKVTN